MRRGKRVVGRHPRPIALEPLNGLRMGPAIRPGKGVSAGGRRPLGVGTRDRLERGFHLGLMLRGHRVEDVPELVVPAALLRALGVDRSQRTPDPKVPIGDRELRGREAAPLQVAEYGGPTLGGFREGATALCLFSHF